MAVVSRAFGTTSVHSSTSTPLNSPAVSTAAGVCSTSDSLLGRSGLPGARRQTHPSVAGRERQLRHAQIQPIAGTEHLGVAQAVYPPLATPSRTRACRENQVFAASASPPCVSSLAASAAFSSAAAGQCI